MRTFVLVWVGQLISLLGTHLTGFALGVWVFQRTGSVTQFALISVCTTLPGIIISPLAGALVDRWERRWAMILSDSGAGLSTLVIALLLLSNHLEIWHIYIATAVGSIFNAFQWPAYTAAITLLVPKRHLGRASGMTQLGEAVALIAAAAFVFLFCVPITNGCSQVIW
jgi:MFS family permease